MLRLAGYRRPPEETQPAYLEPRYVSTLKRAPTQPLVFLPHTISELTGPVFGGDVVAASDHDLTRQHEGEPIGERIIITAGLPLGTPGATNMLRMSLVGENGAAPG